MQLNYYSPQRPQSSQRIFKIVPEIFFFVFFVFFVVLCEIGSSSYRVETLAEQILYGLEFRMQIIQQLFGGGLFFVGSGRQMLAGALDGKLFFIE